jgi:bifunctional non-homologous end joining protein LigD
MSAIVLRQALEFRRLSRCVFYQAAKNFNSTTVLTKENSPRQSTARKFTRTMTSVRGSGKEKLTSFHSPMLATLHDEAFDDKNWIFEIKWDGYRAVAEIDHGNVKLYSRNGLSFLGLYPRVAKALSKIKGEAVLDGEIVVFNQNNKPDFQKLQQYGDRGDLAIAYYVFDCISYKGKSLTHLPLLERKTIAKQIIPANDNVIRYSDHVEEHGKEFFEKVTGMDLEGMIAKRGDSIYQEGKRSRDWLKIKNHNTQEAIIVGFTEPRGSRSHIGALVLAIKEKDHYRYIGHTGTGFTNVLLKDLYQKLTPLITEKKVVEAKIPGSNKITWVKPILVCNVKFTEITADGIMRHPVFMGLRIDKSANETTTLEKPANKSKSAKANGKSEAAPKAGKKIEIINGRELTFTNREKLYWPDEGITKGDVIQYYRSIHKYILPYLKDRPQSLRRNPNGITDSGFFQKEAGENIPSWIKTEKIRAESANRDIDYIICNDLPTLLYLNNLGCIELNPWNSRIQKPDYPDYLIIDLDPSEKNTFDQVIDTAHVIHDLLNKTEVPSYCKTSGASGLHIYVPLHAQYTYDQIRSFAEIIVRMTGEQLPKITTVERDLKKRKGRIYLDYLQNSKGQTLASVYSLRPKPGAGVSTPLEWKEVKRGLHPSDFNIHNTLKRLEKKGDLFRNILTEKIDLKKALKNLQQ